MKCVLCSWSACGCIFLVASCVIVVGWELWNRWSFVTVRDLSAFRFLFGLVRCGLALYRQWTRSKPGVHSCFHQPESFWRCMKVIETKLLPRSRIDAGYLLTTPVIKTELSISLKCIFYFVLMPVQWLNTAVSLFLDSWTWKSVEEGGLFIFCHLSLLCSPLLGGGSKRWCCLTSVCRLHRA